MKTTTIALLLICTAVFAQQKGSFTDPRDKKTYKTVKMGKQTWMAENLNFNAEGSKCYGEGGGKVQGACLRYNEQYKHCEEYATVTLSSKEVQANCAKYGRLYNTRSNICPKGWHVSTREEWQTLASLAGGKSDGSGDPGMNGIAKLMATSGWNKNGNGTDDFGFSALPGGLMDLWVDDNGISDYFAKVGEGGYWWIGGEEEMEPEFVYISDNYMGYNGYHTVALRSVRCVQGEENSTASEVSGKQQEAQKRYGEAIQKAQKEYEEAIQKPQQELQEAIQKAQQQEYVEAQKRYMEAIQKGQQKQGQQEYMEAIQKARQEQQEAQKRYSEIIQKFHQEYMKALQKAQQELEAAQK
jgi:uncharacterized protein (TIGR02145 family)